MRAITFLLLAYLAGSVPAGYLAGRWAGVDLRERGSGNPGSTNVYRVLGPRAAVPVAAVDVLKGFLPVWYFPLWDEITMAHLPLLYGVAAIAGHVWPVFLGFRGGKGIATTAGVVFGLAPVTALVGVLVWSGMVLVTGAASVASLTAVTLLPLISAGFQDPWSTVLFLTGIVPFAWWTHRENVARLRRGEELRLGARRGEAGNGEGEGRGGGR